jgi:exonuclease III
MTHKRIRNFYGLFFNVDQIYADVEDYIEKATKAQPIDILLFEELKKRKMTQRIYEDLLAKAQGWPDNGVCGLILEKEISAEQKAGQISKDQEEYLLRILRQRVDENK